MLASDEDPYALTASGLVFSLMRSGVRAEAMVVAKDGRWEAFWPCFGEQTATGPGSSAYTSRTALLTKRSAVRSTNHLVTKRA